jgi:hypothetical protein
LKILEDYDNWLFKYCCAAKKSLSALMPLTNLYLNSSSVHSTGIVGYIPTPSTHIPLLV